MQSSLPPGALERGPAGAVLPLRIPQDGGTQGDEAVDLCPHAIPVVGPQVDEVSS